VELPKADPIAPAQRERFVQQTAPLLARLGAVRPGLESTVAMRDGDTNRTAVR
jgi:hypothetical protein